MPPVLQYHVYNIFHYLLNMKTTSGVPRGGVWGVQTPPKFLRYRWIPRLHEQEEPASRFPFAVHCVLIRL